MSRPQGHRASNHPYSPPLNAYSISPRSTSTVDTDIRLSATFIANFNHVANQNHIADRQARMSPSYITHQRRPALIPIDVILSPSDEQSVRMRTGLINPYADLYRPQHWHNLDSLIHRGVAPSIRCRKDSISGPVEPRVGSTEDKTGAGCGTDMARLTIEM